MTAREPRGDELGRALRGALPDDLPAEVEADLRREMRAVWASAAAAEAVAQAAAGQAPGRGIEGPSRFWAGWPRPALAAAALLMVIVAGVASPGASRSATEFIVLTQIASGVLQRLGEVTEMECVLETAGEQGHPLRYAITWHQGGETEVRIEREGGTDLHRVVVQAERTSLAELRRAAAPIAAEVFAGDPALWATRDWLTPERLARSLAGAWSPIPGGAPGEAIFRVYGAGDAAPLRVTIDERTRLPVRIEAPSLGTESRAEGLGAAEARFAWQITAPPAPWPARPRGAA